MSLSILLSEVAAVILMVLVAVAPQLWRFWQQRRS